MAPGAPGAVADPAADDAERELRARRRELEMEFDAKQRDLKAQHKRQMDRLEADRREWESYKREQAKALADKVEKARRQESNKQEAKAAVVEAKGDLEELRATVADLRQARLGDATALRKSEERLAAARKRLAGANGRLAVLAVLALAGGAAWLVWARRDGDGLSSGLAMAFLAAVLAGWGVLAAGGRRG